MENKWKQFLALSLEERNEIIKNHFSKLTEELRIERQYTPRLVTDPETGEIGLQMMKGDRNAGVPFPSKEPIRGDLMKPNTKRRWNFFRYGFGDLKNTFRLIRIQCLKNKTEREYLEANRRELWYERDKLKQEIQDRDARGLDMEFWKKNAEFWKKQSDVNSHMFSENQKITSSLINQGFGKNAPKNDLPPKAPQRDGPGIPGNAVDLTIEIERFLSSL